MAVTLSEINPAHRDCYVARWFDRRFHKPQTHYGQTCQCFHPPRGLL